ncbi:MAG: NAD(+) synthase [Firmicutes bacterium]|nr:NAD(+) synthase [Bacillota bacterium]
MNTLGMIRVAAAAPKLMVANPKYNVEEMIRILDSVKNDKIAAILFPELAITGSTCGDLFHQDFLYQKNLEGLKTLTKATKGSSQLVIVGFYLRIENKLYNCAALIQNGSARGVVPKMFPANHREHSDGRWFGSGLAISKTLSSVNLFGQEVPFGSLIFTDAENNIRLGIEVSDDLWVPITPGTQLALNGAQILFNPAANNDIVGRGDYRRQLVAQNSASNICGYVYASAGVTESTTDLVYSGDCMVAENGTILARASEFNRESNILFNIIDFERIDRERASNSEFEACADAFGDSLLIQTVELAPLPVMTTEDSLYRHFAKNPFVCDDPEQFKNNCENIFTIQANALAKRLEHSHSKSAVVGISGGLDSTLALLVTARTFQILGRDPKDIITVTMPGFGTTDHTYQNALTIMRTLGTTMKEVSIVPAVTRHFEDIEHDMSIHDVTYENAQARERTQILMDIANKNNGLVVGTGDLSEVALGWSTYNGDHMSMYGVNCGVPKTLVIHVIHWLMENILSGETEDPSFSEDNAVLKEALQAIMDTPISPELLPPDENGQIAQKTEEKVGPYILHDFFIYHTIRYGVAPKKMLYLAKSAFAGEYDEDYIKKWLKVFYRRFFTQQFKRSCVPDGPKVGSVGLSPRGDWMMPSDADVSLWLAELE